MRTTLTAATLIALVAVGCTGTGSYKSQTEDFLNDTTEAASGVGGDIENAECVEPENTDVGTTYTCVADVDGVPTDFDVEIVGENEFAVSPAG
jgi:hypothetical protein